MKLFCNRMARALNGVGLAVEVSGRNDMTIDWTEVLRQRPVHLP